VSTASLPADAVQDLRSRHAGPVVDPGHPEYDALRRVHNGLIDRRPALLARCSGTSDVVEALAFARAHGLEVAVRGGGHNVAGRSVCDGGLVVDLSAMKGIHVDPVRRSARAQAGVTWGEFNRETQLFGLATTGGVISSTGIAGLTLGGGLGWLMARHGMTVDNLLSAEVVLVDGRVVTASESSEPELFWAIRGGGGNFGIVTSFEYRLHPVGMVTGGIVAHPFERAREVLGFFRELTADLPDEVVVFAGLVHAPDGSGAKLAALVACDCSAPGTSDGRVVERIKAFGEPVVDALGPIPYTVVNTILDGAYPKGALNYWKSSFLGDLTEGVVDVMVERFAACASPMDAILLEHFHGAATRVPVDATAFPHRTPGFNLLVASEWTAPEDTERCTAWARASYAALEPHMVAGRYVNYLGDDETAAEVARAFGPNHARLQAIKALYDPANVLHLNQNIGPAARAATA
jgi:FAD/FMN-containing dehydrogenase